MVDIHLHIVTAIFPKKFSTTKTVVKYFSILFFCGLSPSNIFADTTAQMIRTKKVGVTVSPVRMYADSNYTKSTETTFTEGELFEIVGETVREHYDNTQNQTFKWYKIHTSGGKSGWVFGRVEC